MKVPGKMSWVKVPGPEYALKFELKCPGTGISWSEYFESELKRPGLKCPGRKLAQIEFNCPGTGISWVKMS